MCVVQHVSCLVNLQVSGAPRRLMTMEKVNAESVRDRLGTVKDEREGLDQGIRARRWTMCGSHWTHEEQEFMGDGNGISQVMERVSFVRED